jgi:hypothetical protein
VDNVNGFLEINVKVCVGSIASFGKGSAVNEVGVCTVHDGYLNVGAVLGTSISDSAQEGNTVIAARHWAANCTIKGVEEVSHLLLSFVCLWIYYNPMERKVNGFL